MVRLTSLENCLTGRIQAAGQIFGCGLHGLRFKASTLRAIFKPRTTAACEHGTEDRHTWLQRSLASLGGLKDFSAEFGVQDSGSLRFSDSRGGTSTVGTLQPRPGCISGATPRYSYSCYLSNVGRNQKISIPSRISGSL